MRVGVLALQGDVREHERMLARCGAESVAVRKPDQLEHLQGLIIPGGESTTIGKLVELYGFVDAIRERHGRGMAVYGTCAGLILIARETVEFTGQPLLGLMDIVARRNAFGRQVDSFEADLRVPVLGSEPFRGVFIRAPWIESTGPDVETLSTRDGRVIMARQGNLLATAFHPELTEDERVHRFFLEEVAGTHGKRETCPDIQSGVRSSTRRAQPTPSAAKSSLA